MAQDNVHTEPLKEVFRKVGSLGDEFHDSVVIASYAKRFKYDPARKEEVLKKLGERDATIEKTVEKH